MPDTTTAPGDQVIDYILASESAKDAAALRPVLTQLRAMGARPVPVPSAALQALLDAPDTGTATVTSAGEFASRRAARDTEKSKGQARYGTRRRVAATSIAVVALLGAGTGVAAAVDGGFREQLAGSVGAVFKPHKPAIPEEIIAPTPKTPVDVMIPAAIAATPEAVAEPLPDVQEAGVPQGGPVEAPAPVNAGPAAGVPAAAVPVQGAAAGNGSGQGGALPPQAAAAAVAATTSNGAHAPAPAAAASGQGSAAQGTGKPESPGKSGQSNGAAASGVAPGNGKTPPGHIVSEVVKQLKGK